MHVLNRYQQTIYKSPKIIPNGKDMNGIFDYFLNHSVDPVHNIVDINVSDSFLNDDLESVIYWKNGNGRWASNNRAVTGKEEYYAMNFGTNSVLLTHFSFKGYYGYSFATIFDLYGRKGFGEWQFIQRFNSNDYCPKTIINDDVYQCGEANVENWEFKINCIL